jgi:hypothetical protein
VANANIVSLADVKTHLRYPAGEINGPSDDDAALQKFINAADEVIKFECDDILPKLYNEYFDGGDYSIWLRHIPLLSVENVQEGWGWINFDLDYVEVNSPGPFSLYAYSIDDYPNGEISRRSAGNVQIPFRPGASNIQVQYRAGTEHIPGNVLLGELELIAHWWDNSQLRAMTVAGANLAYDAVSGAAYSRDTETGVQNINIGVPERILELIKAHRHRPIIA